MNLSWLAGVLLGNGWDDKEEEKVEKEDEDDQRAECIRLVESQRTKTRAFGKEGKSRLTKEGGGVGLCPIPRYTLSLAG